MQCTAIVLLASLCLGGSAFAAASQPGETTMTDHAHDFDFLIGSWRVHHWRLKDRLAGSHDWVEFEGSCRMWMTMDGKGNVDDNVVGLPGGSYRAMSVRGYDPKTETWAIWWLDARDPHKIEPPVIGNFQDGIGTFDGDDTFHGKPIKVRFTWSHITANSAHWEQAFSPDGGKTWETNWRMDLTRAE
jgi:hypothetical protein